MLGFVDSPISSLFCVRNNAIVWCSDKGTAIYVLSIDVMPMIVNKFNSLVEVYKISVGVFCCVPIDTFTLYVVWEIV
jgi:hypothetical protein